MWKKIVSCDCEIQDLDKYRENLLGNIFQVVADLNRLENRKGMHEKFSITTDAYFDMEKKEIDNDIRMLEQHFHKFGKLAQSEKTL